MPAWLPACLPDCFPGCLSGVHGRYSNMPHFNWVLLNWRFQPIHKHHQPHFQPLHERKIEPMMTAEIKTQQKNVKKLLRNFNELTAVHFQNSGQPLTSYQCFEHLKRQCVYRCVCVRFFMCLPGNSFEKWTVLSEPTALFCHCISLYHDVLCIFNAAAIQWKHKFFLTCNGAQILPWIFFFYEKPNAYPYSLKRIHPYQQ